MTGFKPKRFDIAGAHSPVEAGVERHQAREQIIPQIVFDVPRNTDERHAHPILEQPLYQRQPDQEPRQL